MERRRQVRTILALGSMIAVAFTSGSVAATERSSGDVWRYSVEFSFEGVSVKGTLVYAYVGENPIEVNNSSFDTHVMKVSGAFSGYLLDGPVNMSVTGLIDGYRYESSACLGIVGEETMMTVNRSVGYDDFWMASSVEVGRGVFYADPLLSAFDPWSEEASSSWNQTTDVFTIDTYDDGSSSHADESSSTETFSLSVASVEESLETGAGTFETRKVTIVSSSETSVMWYSVEVGNFVRTEVYDTPGSTPSFVSVLQCYDCGGSGDDTSLVLAYVAVVLAAAVLVLTLFMVFRRKVGGPVLRPEEGVGPEGRTDDSQIAVDRPLDDEAWDKE